LTENEIEDEDFYGDFPEVRNMRIDISNNQSKVKQLQKRQSSETFFSKDSSPLQRQSSELSSPSQRVNG